MRQSIAFPETTQSRSGFNWLEPNFNLLILHFLEISNRLDVETKLASVLFCQTQAALVGNKFVMVIQVDFHRRASVNMGSDWYKGAHAYKLPAGGVCHS